MDPPLFSVQFHSSQFLPQPDLYIHTPRGNIIPAHATILASASPVLKHVVTSNRVVRIHGVPDAAVTAFLAFLCSSRCTEEDMDEYGIHLLALSHVYSVPQLKRRCIKGLVERVSTESVVDVLQLARLCDAPDLYLRCVKLLRKRFKAVKETEGWKFLERHDPWLELDILQLINEDEKRKVRKWRVYAELSEAMECLEHICTEGCTEVGPYEEEVGRKREPCLKFATCHGLQVLIRHLATCCERKVKGGCLRCRPMWELFRLHSSICLRQHSCKVPLCREIRLKMEQENRKDDARWKVLVRKVASAKALSSLALPKVENRAEGP